MIKDTYLTVVITAFNEEKNIQSCVSAVMNFLASHLEKYEVIFVNDGSTDNTKHELDLFAKSDHLKIIHLPKNLGTGGAIKSALGHISGDWYCWLPSDLEIVPEELLKPLIFCQTSDVVITYIENGHLSRTRTRNALSKAFTFIMNQTFDKNLNYFNGPTLIRSRLLDEMKLESNRFFFHAELLLRILKKTSRYEQVAISLRPRQAELSKAMKIGVVVDVMICFLRSVWELRIINENPHH